MTEFFEEIQKSQPIQVSREMIREELSRMLNSKSDSLTKRNMATVGQSSKASDPGNVRFASVLMTPQFIEEPTAQKQSQVISEIPEESGTKSPRDNTMEIPTALLKSMAASSKTNLIYSPDSSSPQVK